MKNFAKLLISFVVTGAMLISCSDDVAAPAERAMGSIRLSSELSMYLNAKNVSTRETTPLVDFTDYVLTLDDGTNEPIVVTEIEADGIISDIPAGTYDITLSNYEGFTPEYNDPRFAQTKTGVAVEAGSTPTSVEFTLTQANAGVRFVYDDSIDLIGDVTSYVTQINPENPTGSYALTFHKASLSNVGYFYPGVVTLSFKVGDEIITVGGEESVDFTLAAADLLTVTLKADPGPSGLSITATIDTTTEPKDADVSLDPPTPPGPDPDGIYIPGLAGQTARVAFETSATADVTFADDGTLDLSAYGDEIIKTITPTGGTIIYIGRPASDDIKLNIVDGELKFRKANAEGFIPLGAIEELRLIDKESAITETDCFLLEADIDYFNWPMAPLVVYNTTNKKDTFMGVFDGGGHSLHNIKLSNGSTSFTGLFGWVGGTVRNLTIESGTISSTKTTLGGFAGHVTATGVIEHCINKASIVGSSTVMNAGGIAGRSYGIVRFCGNEGNVIGESSVGGIVGDHNNKTAVMIGCYNKADIDPLGGTCGGIIGTNGGEVIACYSIGDVTSLSNKLNVGVGVGTNGGTMSACYAIGEAVGSPAYAGGFVANQNKIMRACYWSGSQRVGRTGTGSTEYEITYLTDGTTIPVIDDVEVASGWPTEDASKNWGIYADTYEGGYYWKDLGTNGVADYPTLWWE